MLFTEKFGKMERAESLLLGKYQIVQDTELYRFTSDAVLLARFLRAKRGERVADFCAGGGIVGLHFFAENTGINGVTLFEMDERMCALAQKTVALNGLEGAFSVENMRVQDAPTVYPEAFSLILCNPPYERQGGGFEKKSSAACRKELALTLDELCEAASRCLKFGGRFALSFRADRLAELVSALRAHALEPKKLQFVAGKRGRKPYLALVAAVKGGKSGLEVLPEAYNETEGF